MNTIRTILTALLWAIGIPFAVIGLAFAIAHVHDTWDAPEYPHSGYSPEMPTWEGGEAW